MRRKKRDWVKLECGCVLEGHAPHVELEIYCPKCSREQWIEILRGLGLGYHLP